MLDRVKNPPQREHTTLDAVLKDCWQSLAVGARHASHPFHNAVLGTSGPDGCEMRTVVLRAVKPEMRQLMCHTDARAPKRAQILRDPRVSWLFYDERRKVQLRVSGTATVHADDTIAKQRWRTTPARARRCYSILTAPGTAIAQADSGLPEHLRRQSPTFDESEPWVENFAVIVTRIKRLEWLHLRAHGHQRARFEWASGNVTGTWLVP